MQIVKGPFTIAVLDSHYQVEELTQAIKNINLKNDETETLNSLRKKQKKLAKLMEDELQSVVKHKETIKTFEDEVSKCKDRIKKHTDRENKLEVEVDSLRKTKKEKEKVDNSDKFLKTLEKKFEEFQESIRREITERNKSMEEQIGQAVQKTYAGAIGTNTTANDDPEPLNLEKKDKNWRRIIYEAHNQELDKEKDQKQRSCNRIIHGIIEKSDESQATKEKDMLFCQRTYSRHGETSYGQKCYPIGN